MARVFVTRRVPGAALERLVAAHEVEIWEGVMPPTAEQFAERAADAEGLLTMITETIDGPLLDRCERLRAISNYAVGLDNVDLAAATERGIPVGYTPDVLTDAVADLTFALLLAAARRLPEAMSTVRAGDWPPWDPRRNLGQEVHGATLGIIGMGRIGSAVAKRARGFEMTVLSANVSLGLRLEELLERSDFVSVHCPLTPETRHLVDAGAFGRMRPNAILINTSRGPVVDQAALYAALVDGSIAGAAIDVTDPEPLPADDPLWSAPNLIITPHIGSASHTARERTTELAVENLLAGLAGRPMPHQANAPVAGARSA